METCLIDFSVDDEAQSIAALVDRIHPLLDPGSGTVAIDFSQCRYLGPDAATILASSVAASRGCGVTVNVVPPRSPQPLVAFWSFSGLDELLMNGSPADTANQKNVTVPVRQIRSGHFVAAEPTIQLVHRFADLSAEDEEYLRVCANEVLQNVEDHSRSSVGAFMCARLLLNVGQIRISITDRGLGILNTLQASYPKVRGAAEALRLVIAGDYSAKSRPSNAGQGIRFLWSAVHQHGGSMFILTDDAIAVQQQGHVQPRIVPLRSPFPGTAVCFSLRVGDLA